MLRIAMRTLLASLLMLPATAVVAQEPAAAEPEAPAAQPEPAPDAVSGKRPMESTTSVKPAVPEQPKSEEIKAVPAESSKTQVEGDVTKDDEWETVEGETEPGESTAMISFGRHFRMSLDGHIIVAYSQLKLQKADQGRRNASVGHNDGFGFGGARLNLRGSYKDLYVRIGFDGALVAYGADDDVVGEFRTGLKGAYARYTFIDAIALTVGRFKPPYDVESLTPTEDQYFVRRSLESRGVPRREGIATEGFNQGRQVGVMLGSNDVLGLETISVGYALALTNGNKDQAFFNDNDLPAFYARVFGSWLLQRQEAAARADEEGPATYGIPQGVQLGASVYYNELTVGAPDRRQSEDVIGLGVDVAAKIYIATFQGQLLWKRTKQLDFVLAKNETGLGFHAQISVEIPGTGLSPGYRFALLNGRITPSDQLVSPDFDMVMHHTAGLRYKMEALPLVAWLEYTRSVEEAGRALPNDRIELAAQVTFE